MTPRLYLSLALSVLLLVACGKKAEEKKTATIATPVTATHVVARTIELLEETVGSLESLEDPTISAEVAGKVLRVTVVVGSEVGQGQVLAVLDAQDASLSRQSAQAEFARVQILSANQERNLERQRQLQEKSFISQAAVDDAVAQSRALTEQLAAARAQLALAERNVGKTNVLSPVQGRVEKQIATPGQYVKVGDPMFQLVTTRKLRARLPFPESMADVVKRGMTVRLSNPGASDKLVAKIDEIRPMTGSGSRAFDAYVSFENPGSWKPGASVNAALVVGVHEHALVIPAQSLVLRPAGTVVYVVQGDRAQQRKVEVGSKQDGMVEIRSGLEEGASVVVDGAGFLTDQAAIAVAKPSQ